MEGAIQFETNGLTVLAVKVEKETYTAFVEDNELIVRMGYEFHQEQDEIELPEGNWRIHAVTTEMTEEQAKMLCPFVTETDYHDFDEPETYDIYYDGAENSIEGLQMFLFHEHGIDPNVKHVLLIKEK